MRKAKPKKRVILPDPVYGDVKVSKFVNHLMYDGKKSISYRIFYDVPYKHFIDRFHIHEKHFHDAINLYINYTAFSQRLHIARKSFSVMIFVPNF